MRLHAIWSLDRRSTGAWLRCNMRGMVLRGKLLAALGVLLIALALFVDWPKEKLGVGTGPFLIGVLGDDPFGIILDETVRDVTVNNRDGNLSVQSLLIREVKK